MVGVVDFLPWWRVNTHHDRVMAVTVLLLITTLSSSVQVTYNLLEGKCHDTFDSFLLLKENSIQAKYD